MTPTSMAAPEHANERKVKSMSGKRVMRAFTARGAVARGERWQRRAPRVPVSASPVKAVSASLPDHTARGCGWVPSAS